ncbi:MAG: hypothetical protein J3R72DRAFT_500743 [Linnemannia gamsii]|nr:MAG: hypothetical protein J3R72DRAFT_500743 [Linnemannia gamsii]
MAHPLNHGCFHSLASLGYIPFALTSVLIASSTPFLDISPIGTILLAFVPTLTLFPFLCLFYRRLERLDAISLTVQRARIYIMLAGSGLCVLVAAQLIMVHVVGDSHNTTYNRMLIPFAPSRLQVREVATWIAGSDSVVDIGSTTATELNVPLVTDTLKTDQLKKVAGDTDKVGRGVAAITQFDSTSESQEHLLLPVSSDSAMDQGASSASIITTAATPAETETGSPDHSAIVHIESRSYPRPGPALVHLLLFLLAQTALLVLLTTLFLGVLIMTEFVLDREDEDVVKARWYFWGRVLGVLTATVVSAVHGSFLSAYVLLDGQSDCIAKAVVATILFYWIAMIALMNRTTGPVPY